MKKLTHKILFNLPEFYLLLLSFLAGYNPPFNFNPFFLFIAIIVMIQITFKNKISGLIIGILFFVINLYFLGALISEFLEFTEFSYAAKKLLFVGLSIWLVNLVASTYMVNKYSAISPKKDSPVSRIKLGF